MILLVQYLLNHLLQFVAQWANSPIVSLVVLFFVNSIILVVSLSIHLANPCSVCPIYPIIFSYDLRLIVLSTKTIHLED